ncbi:GntR family transcriptional regulator [Leucobacter aridicollis]|uniref:DNA-binding GntR family transcriptional regulator n=1 Tax=Leucobacter aridicollis TaxID=283878 RepID=A0A852R7K2_9MICO|nr:GntR family transcriptional regulator [Leucobacter aridicollis]MBL3683477.1 GntR family transcriptional regulator [Leucobacter aridicollis]NYD25216.1 DNA-binding GntR family transcriptional regulator [Leucobacter aridicollis]
MTHARVLLRDTVRDRIRNAIMDGTLAPGEKLNDKELQDWLGVSRTPIRDAINELARMGLVEMEPNRFTRVASPTQEDTLASLQTLGVLYSGALRLALPVLDDETVGRIASRIDLIAQAATTDDSAAIRELAFPTFEMFVAACGNQPLIRLCRESTDGLAYAVQSQRIVDQFDGETANKVMARLAENIRARDVEAATSSLEEAFMLHLPVGAHAQ